MENTIARSTRLMAVLLFVAVFSTACGSSKPAKYRKKRECDCPKWNQLPAPVNGVRAGIVPGTPHPFV